MDRLEDLVAQDDIVSILTSLIDNDNLPHLLFYGPPGTGKVSQRIQWEMRHVVDVVYSTFCIDAIDIHNCGCCQENVW